MASLAARTGAAARVVDHRDGVGRDRRARRGRRPRPHRAHVPRRRAPLRPGRRPRPVPGTSTPYTLELDGERAWPLADATFPESRIRTPSDDEQIRIVAGPAGTPAPGGRRRRRDGSGRARRSRPPARGRRGGRRRAAAPPAAARRPGLRRRAHRRDQRAVAARRNIRSGPGAQVADFEEYTWLYQESWQDPEVRWLLSTVPSA